MLKMLQNDDSEERGNISLHLIIYINANILKRICGLEFLYVSLHC